MEPPALKRLLSAVSTAVAAVASLGLGGCNVLLDNRPADPNADLFATEPADDAGAPRGAARDSDASAPDPGPMRGADPGPADAATAPHCAVGTKPCGDVCVSIDDPSYGCAGPTCGRCVPAHGATAACIAGQCALGACTAAWADCNHQASDGCETDLSLASSCGACGVTCTDAPHAASACVASACSMQCEANFGDCNHDANDGCETQLLKDKHNCGACGQVCLTGECRGGTCVGHP